MSLQRAFALRTKDKIRIAAALSTGVRLARRLAGASPDIVRVRRSGLLWKLDLREGIDFSIYLLGAFERSTVRAIRRQVRPGTVVFDIGANIGAHTLGLARLVGDSGKVYAFEPTAYAFGKLEQNLALNPEILPRVVAEQIMLTNRADAAVETEIYSSWPLFDQPDRQHPKHLGRLESTRGSRALRLDDYVETAAIERLDFIKMDVDGFECHVLGGGTNALKRFRPTLLMELAPYLLAERGRSLDELLSILRAADYRLCPLNGDDALPMEPTPLQAMVSDGASMNVIARPMRPGST
jgi:FkbM family methyltransferase